MVDILLGGLLWHTSKLHAAKAAREGKLACKFKLTYSSFILDPVNALGSPKWVNRLPTKKRAFVIQLLSEGNSLRGTSRLAGVSLNAVQKLMREAGEACADYQDKHLVNLPCKEVQLDELWTFIGCRDRNKLKAKGNHPGDSWTWAGICPKTKLII